MQEWLIDATSQIYDYVISLNDPDNPGQIAFCKEGALFSPGKGCGLGASALAMKTLYQIRKWGMLETGLADDWVTHLQSFQSEENGLFEDPVLHPKADRATHPIAFWKKDIKVRRAETRQAAAALLSAGSAPLYPVKGIPSTESEVKKHLGALPWDKNPWGAGSHTSHLVFFLKLNADNFSETESYEKLLPVIMDFLDEMQDKQTGSWHRKEERPNYQVNAAMKVLTIYRLLGQEFNLPAKLIDLALSCKDGRDACHSLDTLFVLHESSRWSDHRWEEISVFAETILAGIEKHRKADGGFSFFPDHSNPVYYGIPVSEGRAVSDVHGTHLLVWATTLCANLMGFGPALGWRAPVT